MHGAAIRQQHLRGKLSDNTQPKYRNALAHSPRPSSDLLLSLGAVYLQKRDPVHAAEAGRAAMASDPRAAHVLLAQAALARGVGFTSR